MKMFKMSLRSQILVSLFLGVGLGMLAIHFGFQKLVVDWIKPFGIIFLNLLKMLAIPLIFVSLIQGISSISSLTQLSRIGFRTITLYLITTIIAVSVGLIWVNIIKPAESFPADQREPLIEAYSQRISSVKWEETKSRSPLDFLVDIVPENLVNAASENRNMLQMIFFAILFGSAMVVVGTVKAKPLIEFFTATNLVFIKVINIIMILAPLGVFAILASVLVETAGDSVVSSFNVLKALGMYALTVIVGLATLIFIIYPLLLALFSSVRIKDFYKGILPAQMVGFTTSSSVATLPVTMQQCEEQLKLNPSTVSFVIPVGATINMDGTSLYQAVAAVFIASVFGIELTLSQQLIIVLTATLASIGSAGVPSAGIIMLVIVLETLHIPAAGVALIFAVDRPLDMFRTTVNITGDCLICSIVDKSLNRVQ